MAGGEAAAAAATLPSSRSTHLLPKTLTYKKTHLCNNTISSYLNSSSSETLKLKFAKNTSHYVDTRKEQQHQMSFGKKNKEDAGVSFSSDKYFNGAIHEKSARNSSIMDRGGRKNQRKKNGNNVHPKGVKPEAKPQKKSLAASVLKYWFPSELKKVNIKRLFPIFGCKCTCTDAKSVDIEKSVQQSKSSLRNHNKNVNYEGVDHECKEIRKVCNEVFHPNPFSLVLDEYTQPESSSKDETFCQKFDSLSSELQNSSASPVLNSKGEDVTVETQVQEKVRKPLEVFGSPVSVKNVPCRVMEMPIVLGSDGMIYDVDSDSSSDLFEIKNIKLLTLSDYDGEKTPRLSKTKKKGLLASTTTPKKNTSIEKTSIGMSMQKHRDDILVSCRSYNAVNVARNNTYSIAKETQSDPQIRQRLDSATPLSEKRTDHAIQRDFKVTHVARSMRRNSFS